MRGDGRGRDARAPAGARDETERVEEARALQQTDQTAAAPDQTEADFDRAESDADQLASDADQRLSDRDQQASDRDQVVADWELAHAPAAALTDQAHQTSRMEREAATRERDSTASVRSRTTGERQTTAARRDKVSRERELTAAARDRDADARDIAADARDLAADTRDLAADARDLAADTRDRAADAQSTPGTSRPMMADIEQWDDHVLGKLMQRGSMTVGEIMESLERDQFGLPIAHAWVVTGLARELIAKAGGSNESTRYNILAAGRNAAGVRTRRFVVSEKARDGEPYRRS